MRNKDFLSPDSYGLCRIHSPGHFGHCGQCEMLSNAADHLMHAGQIRESRGVLQRGGRWLGVWLLCCALSAFMEPAVDVLKSLNRGVSAVEQLRRRMEADSRAAYVARHHLHCRSKFTCSLGDVATTNASMVPCTQMPARSCAAHVGVEAAGQVGSGASGGGSTGSGAGTSAGSTSGASTSGTYRTDRKRKDRTLSPDSARLVTCGCGQTWTRSQLTGHKCSGKAKAVPDYRAESHVETAADGMPNNMVVDTAQSDRMAVDVANIQVCIPACACMCASCDCVMCMLQAKYLETCEALHLKHYVNTASVQLAKEGFHDISMLTGEAINRALKDVVGPYDLDSMIRPIINAVEPLLTKATETTASNSLYRYPIEAVPRPIGKVNETTLVGASRREVTRERDVIMYDIPLEKVLQRELYYNPGFATHFVDWGDLPTMQGGYADIQDGSAAKSHPMLGKENYVGPCRLGFGHYNDGCEIAGPLGAAKGKFKVELHYVVIYNQPNHVRSRLDQIFLVGVVLASDQKAVGSSVVVQGMPGEAYHGSSLGAAMRRLDAPEGVVFQVPNGLGGFTPRPFRGWLLAVSADTLGAAELIGTKKGFSDKTVSPCYQCNAKRGEHKCINSFLKPNCKFELRTDDEYARQQAFADTRPLSIPKPRQPRRAPGTPKPPTPPKPPPCTHNTSCTCTRAEYMASIGVNTFEHAYTRIPHFRAMSSFPRDVMHVECTGSANLPHHGYAFLYMGIKEKWFTLKQVNQAIKEAQSPHFRVPKIPKIALEGRKGNLPSGKGHLRFTAGQMMQFALHSVEMLRPLVAAQSAESHPIWKAWIAHTQYFQAAMKTSFTTHEVHQLDKLISKSQSLFLAIPEYSALWKPKCHFAQHIAPDIFMFGPPRCVWCMRFEAKNYEHKKAAKLGNWLDIPRQIANFWVRRTAFLLKYEPPEFATQVHFGNVDGMELLNPSLSPEHRLLSLQGPLCIYTNSILAILCHLFGS